MPCITILHVINHSNSPHVKVACGRSLKERHIHTEVYHGCRGSPGESAYAIGVVTLPRFQLAFVELTRALDWKHNHVRQTTSQLLQAISLRGNSCNLCRERTRRGSVLETIYRERESTGNHKQYQVYFSVLPVTSPVSGPQSTPQYSNVRHAENTGYGPIYHSTPCQKYWVCPSTVLHNSSTPVPKYWVHRSTDNNTGTPWGPEESPIDCRPSSGRGLRQYVRLKVLRWC